MVLQEQPQPVLHMQYYAGLLHLLAPAAASSTSDPADQEAGYGVATK